MLIFVLKEKHPLKNILKYNKKKKCWTVQIYINVKYVKQTYDALSHSGLNLEVIAMQIGNLPVREQKKFFRLFLNYVEVTSNTQVQPTMREVIELCERIISVANDYYEEQDQIQLALEGM